jgi:cell division FtsZ-interacting protein ZapD
MFNLYRFNLLERLEDTTTDADRISNAHFVAGVRDFIAFVEKQELLGKLALRRAETQDKKG